MKRRTFLLLLVLFLIVIAVVLFLLLDHRTHRRRLICAEPDLNHLLARQLSRDPKIYFIQNIVTDSEIAEIIRIGMPELKRSTVVRRDPNTVSNNRTSSSAYLDFDQNFILRNLRKRFAYIVGYSEDHIEDFQLVQYRKGQQYKPHFDYFPPGSAGYKSQIRRGGQRHITLFVYLNSLKSSDGGETSFPKLGISVKPKKGSAVLFYNCLENGREDPRTLHAGNPIRSDTMKFGLNVWIRSKTVR